MGARVDHRPDGVVPMARPHDVAAPQIAVDPCDLRAAGGLRGVEAAGPDDVARPVQQAPVFAGQEVRELDVGPRPGLGEELAEGAPERLVRPRRRELGQRQVLRGDAGRRLPPPCRARGVREREAASESGRVLPRRRAGIHERGGEPGGADAPEPGDGGAVDGRQPPEAARLRSDGLSAPDLLERLHGAPYIRIPDVRRPGSRLAPEPPAGMKPRMADFLTAHSVETA